MTSRFEIQYRDYNGETSNATFKGVDLSAANFAAEASLRTALRTAVNGITSGEQAKETVVAIETIISGDSPTDPYSQRETKWLVKYHDTVTNRKYQLEIPTADLSLLANNLDTLDLTAGAGLAFKEAFENFVRSPAGNTVVLDFVVHVGRNI